MNFFRSLNLAPTNYEPETIEKDMRAFMNVIKNDDVEGINFNGVKALNNSDVATAINMIATDIAGLKITTVDGSDDDLLELLNIKPNKYMTGYALKYSSISNMILCGNAYVEIIRNELGRAIRLEFLSNDNVKVKIAKDENYITRIFYEVKRNKGDNYREVSSEDMMHFKTLSIDGIVGRSPLKSLNIDLNIDNYSKKLLDNFFKNGTHTGGILTAKGESLSKEEKDIVRAEWQKQNAGLGKSSQVIVLDEDFEYKKLEVDTEIIKLVNSNNNSKIAVAQVLGIPLHKMGLSTSNMDLAQLNQDYLISTLKQYLDIILSELHKLDSNKTIKFDFNVDEYKNLDPKILNETVKTQHELGLISVDEGREKLGYKPLNNDVGDKHITNLNFVNSKIVDEYQMNKSNLKGGENNDNRA
ncbi:Phage portal protein [Macrococcoides caseolyticum]|uniref:phage portal protein n=2 Tax=Macrococcoides caseolyticum TaxID=69966 RepID=UPI000A29525A|nr:phage portal protein [Macrococcus caseolyticus]ARQ04391.1 Phage portal protein [Macrococcus caseolyticus]PKE13236.1 phage portal protein [Macrococcus caseolyticus]